MAKRYRPVDRDQSFLLPPDMREWLPEDHLVWLVLAVVRKLDTSAFHARPGRSWAGRARFDPDMMLALLVYSYANRVLSSRRIEALCAVDVAFRVICGGDTPDHATLARFRRKNLAAFEDLFAQVLVLCAQAGMARVGTVAIDGTKIAANASDGANRSEQWLRAQAVEMAAAAEATDAGEDELFGVDRRGDEVPDDLVDPSTRDERIETLLRRAEADRAARDKATAEKENTAREFMEKVREGDPRPGRAPAGTDPVEVAQALLDNQISVAEAKRADWQARADAAARNDKQIQGRAPAADPAQAPAVLRAGERLTAAIAEALAAATAASATPTWKVKREIAAREYVNKTRGGLTRQGRPPAGVDPVELARARLDRETSRTQAKRADWQARADAAARNGKPIRGRGPAADPAGAPAVRRAGERLATVIAAAPAAGSATSSDTATSRTGGERGAVKLPTPPQQVNKYNVTDPDSRTMPTRKGWIQGYNGQIAVTSDHVILAVAITQDPGDMDQFSPMLDAAVTAARQLAPHRPAPTGQTPPGQPPATPPDSNPDEIVIALFDAGYFSDANLTAPGPDRLIAPGKNRDLHRAARQDPAQGPPPEEASATDKMSHRLRTPEGIATYKRRGATVEPLNGHLKDRIGLRTFSMRGLRACQAELQLAAATLNLLKLHRHGWKPAT